MSVLGLAVGSYALLGGQTAEATGPPNPRGYKPFSKKQYCERMCSGALRLSGDPWWGGRPWSSDLQDSILPLGLATDRHPHGESPCR